MRRKNQGERRAQLAAAAREVLLQHGAVGLRVKDVAARAGLSPSTLLYYYPEIDELLLEVARAATDRFAENRARAVRELSDPREQLRLAIRLGIPTGPDDEESRLLYELDAMTGTSTAFAALSTAYFDRQVALYESVLVTGTAAGHFQPAVPVDAAARGLVALEDGLGLQVVLGHPSIDSGEAERVLLAYAETVARCELPR